MTSNVFLGLGSNKGNRFNFISAAVKIIDSDDSCEVLLKASLYESEAYGVTDQDNFLNTVIEIKTSLNAEELFYFIKGIEKQLGRTETYRWGPREIDIDILFFDDFVIKNTLLEVPHKDLLNRDFVMLPMVEIRKEFVHPVEKKRLIVYIDKLQKNIIKKYNWKTEEVELV